MIFLDQRLAITTAQDPEQKQRETQRIDSDRQQRWQQQSVGQMLRVPAAAQATAVAGQIGETHVCPTIVGICGRTIEHFEGARRAGQVHAVDEQHERPHEFRSVEFVRFAVHEAAVVALVPAEGQSEKHHDARSDQ